MDRAMRIVPGLGTPYTDKAMPRRKVSAASRRAASKRVKDRRIEYKAQQKRIAAMLS
jgi:hypothetical protein